MFKHILVPTDGSTLSDETVAKAIDFARETGAKLTIFNASAEPPFPVTNFGEEGRYDPGKAESFAEDAAARGQAIANTAVEQARAAGVAVDYIVEPSASPGQAIIRIAERCGCDLIFMASHARSGISALLLGSETQKVLTECKIPVLVFR
jgi:nucleotide-binding universal stress UspA family protein